MFDITNVVLAGAGGLSLTFAVIHYRLSRKKRTEA
jgi:uncharacterized membrane protein SpoIIM required for sporulation